MASRDLQRPYRGLAPLLAVNPGGLHHRLISATPPASGPLQPFIASSLHRFNDSTIQRFNDSTSQEWHMLANGDKTMITRRKFLNLTALTLPVALGAHARFIEPTMLRVTKLDLSQSPEKCRFVHFTDFHYKGNTTYAAEVVRTINRVAPEFVCFTGDLVEEARFAQEALGFIQQIQAPVYGSPGNHDYWSQISFPEVARAFAATGGEWLVDRSVVLPKHNLELVGMAVQGIHALTPPKAKRQVLLMHYPEMANRLQGRRFDLILAGHSHGGQVRLPFLGALIVPHGVGPYDLGYYDTPGGPLYVNAGIGTYRIPLRFNCRPEVTVVTI